MFFPFLAATIVGAGAVKLGAMSAMVSVLSLALQVLIVANVIGVGYLLWRRFSKTDTQ
jgi:membrane protein implicated in regulation of membrane protease activity